MKNKLYILFFVLIILLNSCSSNKKLADIYRTSDCVQKSQTISFNAIINSPVEYNNRFVEISGYYHWTPEGSAISIQTKEPNSEKMVWVDFDPELARNNGNDTIFLIKSLKEFEKIKGRKIKIRGTIEASDRKYLGEFAARIKNVCYLEILN